MFFKLLKTAEDFLGDIILSSRGIFLKVMNYRFKPIKHWSSEISGSEENFVVFIGQPFSINPHI